MTEQEKKIKRYVNAIERELRLPLKAKARINGDIGTDPRPAGKRTKHR